MCVKRENSNTTRPLSPTTTTNMLDGLFFVKKKKKKAYCDLYKKNLVSSHVLGCSFHSSVVVLAGLVLKSHVPYVRYKTKWKNESVFSPSVSVWNTQKGDCQRSAHWNQTIASSFLTVDAPQPGMTARTKAETLIYLLYMTLMQMRDIGPSNQFPNWVCAVSTC